MRARLHIVLGAIGTMSDRNRSSAANGNVLRFRHPGSRYLRRRRCSGCGCVRTVVASGRRRICPVDNGGAIADGMSLFHIDRLVFTTSRGSDWDNVAFWMVPMTSVFLFASGAC